MKKVTIIGNEEIIEDMTTEEIAALSPLITTPSVVSMRQARRALLEKSLLASVQPVIDALPSPSKEAAQIDWEYAQEVKRNAPLVQALASALSLTEQDLDELFTLAASF